MKFIKDHVYACASSHKSPYTFYGIYIYSDTNICFNYISNIGYGP